MANSTIRADVGVWRMDDVVLESELLDVTDINLEQLDALPDSVLRAALRRVLTERTDMPDRYSIFESSL